METPLQVMIMSFILERFATLPSDRYRLFTRYYEAIYDRERGKRNHLARRLSEHQADINHIHQRIGLILQARAKITGPGQTTAPTSTESGRRCRRVPNSTQIGGKRRRAALVIQTAPARRARDEGPEDYVLC